MITKWKLYNFKSIKKETELEFAPLTIFAGANSCGKSTILQSILLISQTLASKTVSKSVILNGPLVKLGQFDDIKSFGSDSDQILIGWECTPLKSESPQSFSALNPQSPHWFERNPIRRVSAEMAFDVKSSGAHELLQLNPKIFGFVMHTESVSEDKTPILSEISILSRAFVPKENESIDENVNLEGLNFQISLDTESLRELQEIFASVEPVGCVLSHFLPRDILVRYDEAQQDARSIIAVMMDWTPRYLLRQKEYNTGTKVSYDTLMILKSILGEHGSFVDELIYKCKHDKDLKVSLRDVIESMRPLSSAQRTKVRELLDWNDVVKLITETTLKSSVKKSNIVQARLPRTAARPIQYLQAVFSQKIKYLGPLRDEPRSLYPLTANVDPSDVGLKGEYTAAVLNSCKDFRIRYIAPDSLDQPLKGIQVSTRTLSAAVMVWLKYLGVAETVETYDKGKHGHELKITTQGTNLPQDLTHVGVGVSQVLPILVLCLLADKDTTIIIEQPELHLHPMVQTRLADFFICVTRLGVQCIIETHSEHIINRLRARIAEDPQNTLYNMAKIYFGLKENGQTIFKDVEVNEFGAIQNWPEGFFDQGQDESETILRNASLKRKRLKDEGKNA